MDSTGHPAEIILDVIGPLTSIYDMAQDPSLSNAGFLLWDAVSVALPFIPGSYIVKVLKLQLKWHQKRTIY